MDTSGIFNKISGNYGQFNHLFSMNIDKRWRRMAARTAVRLLKGNNAPQPAKVLDLACGTGDLSFPMAKRGMEVIGVDLSEGMLEVGRHRMEHKWKKEMAGYIKPVLMKGDGAHLNFADETFDLVTIGYGIRNFDDRPASLSEIKRVLKPSGILLILEFGEPRNAFIRWFYKPYFKYVIPSMASALTLGKEGSAYRYFIKSVENFPKFERFCEELTNAGFKQASYRSQSGGISVLYTAFKERI